MNLSWDDIHSKAIAFSNRWKGAASEKQQDQGFIEDFLRVFGVLDARTVGTFQEKTKIEGQTKWIDYLWKGKIAIEMKTRGEKLDKAMDQLSQYMYSLPAEEVPDLWLVSDFENIRISRHSTNELFTFKTRELRNYIKHFSEIAGYETERVQDTKIEDNVKAAEKMAKLHDALKVSGYDGHDLQVYLVRLLFCLFANDTSIFPKGHLYSYIQKSNADSSDLSDRISRLFDVLNMDEPTREKRTLLSDELKQFRYINGALFAGNLPPADFDQKMRLILLECLLFDWHKISPAIFGAMFQGVMDTKQRRELGAHYTSEENILKLIKPLFLDELYKEFNKAKTDPTALDRFHDKIAGLKFLDPACGCGNFLIITYRELRLLEIEVLKMKINTAQRELDISHLLKVNVGQFYGIEYEGFPCEIAKVGMWLIDHLMNLEVSDAFGQYFVRLPLKQSATIVHGNALRIDWESVVPKRELSYILGNPPFLGYSNQSDEQKEDILSVYVDGSGKPYKNAGKIDYVATWYYKASKYLTGTKIRAAFVSTNSITQGEQIAAVWKPLFDLFGIEIDFGYRTFKWSNEAKGKAAVHCVIVGFSTWQIGEKVIYDDDVENLAKNINPYLVDAPNVFMESRKKPLCDVPEMCTGNRPADGGHLIIEDKNLEAFVKADPLSEKYIRRFMGSEEFINNKRRWCLWLVGVAPEHLRKMPEVMKRIALCKKDRENAPDAGRRKLADKPTLFREQISSEIDYIVVPKVSSERRRYIPIGFVSASTIASDLLFLIPNSNLYHFGILTSSVHMTWTRYVCGRLKSDYRYSKDVVYNNFPWPNTTDEQKSQIVRLAQGILDARSIYPENSLAALYDPLTMPLELQKAHRELDRAVMRVYGFGRDMTEAEIVAELMELYLELTGGTKQ